METDNTTSESYDEGFPDPCPQCGSAVDTEMFQHTFRYGNGQSAADIAVLLPLRRCAQCDFEYLDHEGERVKHEALCRHLGVLTPSEIRGVRERRGLTRAEFAELTGLGVASLNRWENGTSVQSVANDRYLRLLDLPDGLSRLRAAVHSTHGSTAGRALAGQTGVKRFALLVVTDDVKAQQSAFQLRKAA